MNTTERINHPAYYSHPSGIECIDLIRHYTCDIAMALKYLWRAGLKTEKGISGKDKEKEDIRKAIWYIEDYRKQLKNKKYTHPFPTGYKSIAEIIAESHTQHVAEAIRNLAYVGCIIGKTVTRTTIDEKRLDTARKCLTRRLDEIDGLSLTDKF